MDEEIVIWLHRFDRGRASASAKNRTAYGTCCGIFVTRTLIREIENQELRPAWNKTRASAVLAIETIRETFMSLQFPFNETRRGAVKCLAFEGVGTLFVLSGGMRAPLDIVLPQRNTNRRPRAERIYSSRSAIRISVSRRNPIVDTVK
jgi:hypothetical protein